MPDAVIAWPMLAAFLVASLVLAVTPGPAVVYIVTRTIAQGRRAGLASVAGVALGNLGNAIGASVGLAALFAVSSLAFSVVKYAGAAYLIYLGIKALRAAPAGPASSPASGTGMERQAPQLGRIFRDGFLVALLNPKTAIFFAAFLPQFIDPAASAVIQSILFGAAFVLIAALTDMVYVLAANAAAPAFANLKGIGAAGRYATASVFIGLGVFTAASGSNTATTK
ncbi:LysE family translocator [Noviherbaspirillum sp.]|uniref:LysE family translocator n=1 Tax=Noviherbaspirillum sp. TaxID=1926288 RepID=UPI002FE34F76